MVFFWLVDSTIVKINSDVWLDKVVIQLWDDDKLVNCVIAVGPCWEVIGWLWFLWFVLRGDWLTVIAEIHAEMGLVNCVIANIWAERWLVDCVIAEVCAERWLVESLICDLCAESWLVDGFDATVVCLWLAVEGELIDRVEVLLQSQEAHGFILRTEKRQDHKVIHTAGTSEHGLWRKPYTFLYSTFSCCWCLQGFLQAFVSS